ncbi:MAG: peptidase M75 [Bacteroidales bacterium]|nr:peptidase M75 [Bacteroidales bacterium]
MKKFFLYSSLFVAALGMNACFTACDDDDNKESSNDYDSFQAEVLATYVDDVVIPTYKSLADAAAALAEDCEDLSSQEKVAKACDDWKEARKYWERSEAFLFGAASDYNIDPHIDSWPLDLSELAEVLAKGTIESMIESGTAGQGLLGFHAVEYIIFKEGSTGDASNRVKDVADITEAEAVFAAAVSADMRDQCFRLEAAWAGLENVSAEKQKALEEAELEPTLNYGELLKNAGLEGNVKYKTQAAAFEEIIANGAADIANEVGNTKISDPMKSHQWSDVESPHSWNSVTDFVDNIVSVRNAYYGTLDGTRSKNSVSAHIASLDKNLDQDIQDAIAKAIAALEAMPRPFRNYIYADTDAASKALIQAAVDACNDLVDELDEATEAINK